jgi:hypothetical protein
MRGEEDRIGRIRSRMGRMVATQRRRMTRIGILAGAREKRTG